MPLVDAGLGMTRLEWLNSPAKDASAAAVKTSIDKLTWFWNIDAHQLDLSMLPNERRRFRGPCSPGETLVGYPCPALMPGIGRGEL